MLKVISIFLIFTALLACESSNATPMSGHGKRVQKVLSALKTLQVNSEKLGKLIETRPDSRFELSMHTTKLENIERSLKILVFHKELNEVEVVVPIYKNFDALLKFRNQLSPKLGKYVANEMLGLGMAFHNKSFKEGESVNFRARLPEKKIADYIKLIESIGGKKVKPSTKKKEKHIK